MNQQYIDAPDQLIDVNQVIRSTEVSLRANPKPGIVVNFMLGAADCHIKSNPAVFKRIIDELISNALKYTTAGSVTFGYEIQDDELYVFVRDTGMGISPDKKNEILNSEPTFGSEITNLSWVIGAVENLGGEFGIDSRGEGRGANFWFTVPYDESLDDMDYEEALDPYSLKGLTSSSPVYEPQRPVQAPAQPAAPTQPVAPAYQPVAPTQPVAPAHQPATPVQTETPAYQPAAPAQPVDPQPAVAPQPAAEARPFLLIAEDNSSNYLLFESVLGKRYDLVHAWDGVEAVELFSQRRPDVILMDINMPRKDGYEATNDIRSMDTEVPIIAVTAYAFASDRERILRSGFNSYLSKPINPQRLIKEIESFLNR